MHVIKRNGKTEPVKFDKVTARIEKLSYGLSPMVNAIDVAKKTIGGIYEGVPTTELDNLAAETAASLTITHPDYAILASRIAVSNLHKNTLKSFSGTMLQLHKIYRAGDITIAQSCFLLAVIQLPDLFDTRKQNHFFFLHVQRHLFFYC